MDTISYLKYYYYYLLAHGQYFFSYVTGKIEHYPREVKVASMVSVFCLLLISVLFIRMIFLSRKHISDRMLRDRIVKKYGAGMEFVLSPESPLHLSQPELARAFGIETWNPGKPILHRRRDKAMFADVFYSCFIDHQPESSRMDLVHQMLELFGIPEFLEREVSLGSKKRQVDGLNKVRTFNLQISPWIINKLLNSKSMRLQRLAMYSTIMSSSDSALEYFETDFFDKNSCIKDEIELAYSLSRRRKSGLKLPNLARWAHIQDNERTQCMFVRLMRRFNEVEYCGELTDLFRQERKKKLIEEISRTWGYLHYVESEDLLIDTLMTQPDDTKVAIMHALTRLGTGRSMQALLEGFEYTTNPHVRFEALRCMYNYGPEGRAMFLKLEEQATDADRRFFSFFHNPITLEKISLDKEQAYHPSVETVYNG